MNSAFEKLSEDKKNLIIDICMEEFAAKGYENTLTDIITSRAGISKGILFYYFKNKKGLYMYMVNKAIDIIVDKTLVGIREIAADDYFEYIREVLKLKIGIGVQCQNEYKMITQVFLNPPNELKKEIEELYFKLLKLKKSYDSDFIKHYMNKSRLRSSVSLEKAMEFTTIVFEQLGEKYLKIYRSRAMDFMNDMDSIVEEINSYIDMIKYGIYKPYENKDQEN